MAKDPAFLFYPNDWLGETIGMTFEQKGAYLELLMLQFNRGHMSLPIIRQVVGELWAAVQCHFVQDEEGLYYSARLEEEMQRRRAYSASRRSNLKGSPAKDTSHMDAHMDAHMDNHMDTHMDAHMDTHMDAHMDTHMDAHMDSHMETGTETETGTKAKAETAPKGKRFTPPTREEVAAYCAELGGHVSPQRFVDFYASKGWLVGKSPMKDWKAAVRNWNAGETTGRESARGRPMTGKYSEVI